MAIQPPRERAKPENRAMQKCRELRKRVSSRYVGHLMGKHSTQFAVIPIAPDARQQYRGVEHPNRDGYGD
jgi:hypothetical protein